jgi:hypothetical protein
MVATRSATAKTQQGMDHKLAIVIVPRDSEEPAQASRALLERFQKVPPDGTSDGFEPKFSYKCVGGWFDGLANGNFGRERWSTVLRMLLDGITTNALWPFPGFASETVQEIPSPSIDGKGLSEDQSVPMGRFAADATLPPSATVVGAM